jgi:hypothetical protein
LHYFSTAAAPELDPLSNIAFSIFKPAIDASFADFEATSARNRKNIEKRWRESDTTRIESKQVETSGNDSLPTDTEDRSKKSEDRGKNTEDRSKRTEDFNIKADKPPTPARFVKPTVEEVDAYRIEQGLNLNPHNFVDYYDSVGWVVGKNKPMKDWKAAAKNWARREKQSAPVDITSPKSYEMEGFDHL